PTEQMRRAMAEAKVGDDVYREDPTVNRLQARAAEIFGREAALFVPSGTMANLISIYVQCERGQEVICDRRAHICSYELSAISAIAGAMPRVVDGVDGILSWELIEPHIHFKTDHHAATGLISLENTHNTAGGTVYTAEQCDDICAKAHEKKIPIHLDGARIFNAAVALGKPVAELTRGFDSLNFCLSKGLGAPVGSLVVGSREFFEKARRVRKVLGGGMRQAGVLAAAGLIALEESPKRLHEDHDNARWLAEQLANMRGIKIDPAKVVTNIVIFDVTGTGMDGFSFLGRLAGEGVLANPLTKSLVRFVTHCDVSRADIEKAVEAIHKILK
ncbi:PLP-dependent transferase, partial [Candidatus Sumerlaeota bacterium]|nr:PLP-dependent transferase [Candidatus Sumerlaeota bacterium]